MSLRDLLVEELKRRGVAVVPEVSFRTVDRTTKNPDAGINHRKSIERGGYPI